MAIRIFLTIRTEEGKAESVHKTLTRFPEVVESHRVLTGDYDVVAFVEVKTMDRYRAFSVDQIATIEGVIDYTSFLTIGPGE
ncbi:MAG: Lrp/AsnC ligand binding domain-containing protein [Candidatus Thorarchaeota archaeon]|nr:MAG: Lrp/AsnC ligand binding domain-containing protein [Candidatus Thorarchaeota archaeon]